MQLSNEQPKFFFSMTILAENPWLTKSYVVKKFYPTMDKYDIPDLEMSTS